MKFFTAVALFGAASALKLRVQEDTDVTAKEIIEETAAAGASVGLTEEDAEEIFDAIDVDGDGQLTASEVVDAARSDEAAEAFRKFMASGASKKHKDGAQWAADRLAESDDAEVEQWLSEKFGHLNTDGVDGLSKAEITAVLAQTGEGDDGVDLEDLSGEEFLEGAAELAGVMGWDLEQIYADVDTDGVEGISGEEALAALRSEEAGKMLKEALGSDLVDDETKAYLREIAAWVDGSDDATILEDLDDTFGHMDENENGQLTWDEMEDAVDGPDLEDLEDVDFIGGLVGIADAMGWDLEQIYDDVDTDGSDGISGEEALAALRSEEAGRMMKEALGSGLLDRDTEKVLEKLGKWVEETSDEDILEGLGETFGDLAGDDEELSWDEMAGALEGDE